MAIEMYDYIANYPHWASDYQYARPLRQEEQYKEAIEALSELLSIEEVIGEAKVRLAGKNRQTDTVDEVGSGDSSVSGEDKNVKIDL